jgi:hypothetical protein
MDGWMGKNIKIKLFPGVRMVRGIFQVDQKRYGYWEDGIPKY